MSPASFEEYCHELVEKNGWKVYKNSSIDGGIDIRALKEEKDGKIIKYIFKDNVKSFPKHFKYLEENNIIINNGTHQFCFWGEKQDLDVTYLVITT